MEQTAYSLRRIHTMNNVLYLGQFVTAYLFLLSNEQFVCDEYIYFLTIYLTVFTLMLNGCFLMRFICAPLQGYPRERLSQSIIGYCFPLAMAITHIICCCGLFSSMNNHLLYRKTNTSQIISTLIIFITILCIYCNSKCIASSFTYRMIILYFIIAIIHLSFAFNSYLISYRKIKCSLHAFIHYIIATCIICIELINLILLILNYTCLTWIIWYILNIPFIYTICYWYYVRMLYNSMPYVMQYDDQLHIPLIYWLLYNKQRDIIIDKLYCVLHFASHFKDKSVNKQHRSIQNKLDKHDKYIRISSFESNTKGTYTLNKHSPNFRDICLKYQLQYVRIDGLDKRLKYIQSINKYHGLFHHYCSKFVLCLIYKILMSIYPIFWFFYGYIYLQNVNISNFIQWISMSSNKCENLMVFILICIYIFVFIIVLIFGYKAMNLEYYYGFIRHSILKIEKKKNRIHKLEINEFYESLIFKQICFKCLNNSGFVYDICCLIIGYLDL